MMKEIVPLHLALLLFWWASGVENRNMSTLVLGSTVGAEIVVVPRECHVMGCSALCSWLGTQTHAETFWACPCMVIIP